LKNGPLCVCVREGEFVLLTRQASLAVRGLKVVQMQPKVRRVLFPFEHGRGFVHGPLIDAKEVIAAHRGPQHRPTRFRGHVDAELRKRRVPALQAKHKTRQHARPVARKRNAGAHMHSKSRKRPKHIVANGDAVSASAAYEKCYFLFSVSLSLSL